MKIKMFQVLQVTFACSYKFHNNVDESLLLAPTFDKYIILALQLFVFYYLVAKSSKISGETEQLTASVVRMRWRREADRSFFAQHTQQSATRTCKLTSLRKPRHSLLQYDCVHTYHYTADGVNTESGTILSWIFLFPSTVFCHLGVPVRQHLWVNLYIVNCCASSCSTRCDDPGRLSSKSQQRPHSLRLSSFFCNFHSKSCQMYFENGLATS